MIEIAHTDADNFVAVVGGCADPFGNVIGAGGIQRINGNEIFILRKDKEIEAESRKLGMRLIYTVYQQF